MLSGSVLDISGLSSSLNGFSRDRVILKCLEFSPDPEALLAFLGRNFKEIAVIVDDVEEVHFSILYKQFPFEAFLSLLYSKKRSFTPLSLFRLLYKAGFVNAQMVKPEDLGLASSRPFVYRDKTYKIPLLAVLAEVKQ